MAQTGQMTRAALLKAPWQVQIKEVPLESPPPPGWALLRVDACGICGSDLNNAQLAEDWSPFGHEVAATIEALPGKVDHLRPGDKVVCESASFCGKCELCRNGRVDLCNKAPNFLRQPAMGVSEYMLAPLCCLVPYEGLTPDVACLTEPAGVAYDMVRVADIRIGQRVCVIGPGPIGLAAAAMAKHAGAIEVLVIGRREARRLEVARKIGCETAVITDDYKNHEKLHRKFHHVLVTAPPALIPPSFELLANEGICTYVGLALKDPNITFDANDFHVRKLQLRASFASPAMFFPRTLDLLKAGIIPGEDLVSHRFSLEQAQQALLVHRDNKEDIVKVIVKPERK